MGLFAALRTAPYPIIPLDVTQTYRARVLIGHLLHDYLCLNIDIICLSLSSISFQYSFI